MLGDASFSRFYPTPNLKFVLDPTQNPDASQWNIGCMGPNAKCWRWPCIYFFFFGRFHLRLGPNVNPISGGIWALMVFNDMKQT